MAFVSVTNASTFGPDIGQANQSANRVFDVIDAPSEIDALLPYENPTNLKLDFRHKQLPVLGDIEFQGVWFSYPNRKNQWVLKNFSLVIKRNESVALVG